MFPLSQKLFANCKKEIKSEIIWSFETSRAIKTSLWIHAGKLCQFHREAIYVLGGLVMKYK